MPKSTRMIQVGESLKRARVAAGLTQRELAARAKKSHQLVDKIEQGQNTTVNTLDALARGAGAELRLDFVPPSKTPADRLVVGARLLAILPHLPTSRVDALLHEIALWETQYSPDSKKIG